MLQKFWFVWNPNGNAPRYQHATLESAEKEADRLASNTSEEFYVLEAVSRHEREKPPVKRTPLTVRALPAVYVEADEIHEAKAAPDTDSPW